MIISVFAPHGGCPERCHFCDQSVSGGTPVSSAKITNTIEEHLATSRSEPAEAIAFYGGTFTAMPKSRQLKFLDAAKPYLDSGRISSVRIATRPDALELEWLQRLVAEYRLTTVELGVQTFNAPSLLALGRSHSLESVATGVALLKKLELKTGLHLMIGVPGERQDEDSRSLAEVLKLGVGFVRIHPLLVLRGTELEKSFRRGEYVPLGLEQATQRAAWLTAMFEENGVRVIRLGLQPNELLGQAVVGGPYHPAFGDLVRSRLACLEVAKKLEKIGEGEGDIVEIALSPRLYSALRAHGGAGEEWLKTRFNLPCLTVRVVGDRPIHYDEIEVRLYHSSRSSERGQIQPAQ